MTLLVLYFIRFALKMCFNRVKVCHKMESVPQNSVERAAQYAEQFKQSIYRTLICKQLLNSILFNL